MRIMTTIMTKEDSDKLQLRLNGLDKDMQFINSESGTRMRILTGC